MAKLSNMLVMINLLKSGRKYSVKELAERLEVSERVVREYKLFLEEAGIYLETIRGPYGGYVLNRDVVIPNLKYSQRDRNTLINKDDYDKFIGKKILNVHTISEFAKTQGVLPGIVIGRIQNDTKDYSFLTKYKEKYVWQ